MDDEKPIEEVIDTPEATEETTQVEEKEAEVVEAEAPVEEAPQEITQEVPQEPEMSHRKAKRLEKLEGLVERLKGKPEPAAKTEGIDYRQMIDAPDEVYQQLETKSQEYGQAQFNAGLEEAKSIRFHTRLEIDAPRVEAKYPQFDKNSEEFNPGLANTVNEWYLATVGYDGQSDRVNNPNLRYSDFVEGIMELADNVGTTKAANSVKNIAKQAASTGLRPDGSTVKPMDLSKDPQDMTNEELEAAIGSTMPRDSRGRFTKQ